MFKFPLERNYTTGWYTLERENAINGLKSSLSKRKGVKNIFIEYCSPAQLEGDMGYEMQVSYQEDLDETFGFPKNLDKVIFLDVDSYPVPYGVREIARETQAGIVITTPSLKDEFYDVGSIFPQALTELMEDANKRGIQIVGITPSINSMSYYNMTSSEMVEKSIILYLQEHPSIKNFIIINKEDMQELSPYSIKDRTISLGYEEKARNILNGKGSIKQKTK